MSISPTEERRRFRFSESGQDRNFVVLGGNGSGFRHEHTAQRLVAPPAVSIRAASALFFRGHTQFPDRCRMSG